ncbi:MAG: enoyl-CoA hydratase-related protein [Desulfobacterales bacterium]
MNYDNILYEIHDHVGIITLNRPEALNSLTLALMEDVRDAIGRAAADSGVRVLVMTGAGKGFCSGADLAEPGAGSGDDRYAGLSIGERVSSMMKSHFNPLIMDIFRLKKPVIAAVNGIAAGGGVGLALSTDIVVAARSAAFSLVFGPKLGIVPDMGATWHLPRLIGRSRSLGLAFSGDRLPAETAAQWGMICRCVEDDRLMEEVLTSARRLAQGPTKAYGYIKRAFEESGRNRLDEQLEFERYCQLILCDSDDFMEGVAAFLEKRKPDFKGQ